MTKEPGIDNKLSQIFDYVKIRNKYENGFLDSIVTMYSYNAKWSNFTCRILVDFFSLFIKPKKDSIKYFFWGIKYEELILGLPKENVCVVGGPKQLMFCIKHNLSFLPVMKLWLPLLNCLKENNSLTKYEHKL